MGSELTLITGASSDIGCALVRALLEDADGPRVIGHAFARAEKLTALQQEFGDRLQIVQADFSDSESVEAMAEHIAQEHGAPASFVHLPALRLNYERFTKFDLQRFEKDMAIQVGAAVILLKKFLPGMAKMPRGRVVFVLSSVVHGLPPKFLSTYTTIKYAQLGLMRGLAADYAASSVRINAISPGMVETQFLGEIPEVAVRMSASANPQGRNATPNDLLGAFKFLLSPDSDYIHGIDIPVAGGSVC